MHHIVADGWSVGDLRARAVDALRRRSPPDGRRRCPSSRLQYADFAVWQREHLSGERLDALLAHWRSRLADLPRPGAAHRPPPPRVARLPGRARTPSRSRRELSDAVRELAPPDRATPFMVLLAAFVALLQRYTGTGRHRRRHRRSPTGTGPRPRTSSGSSSTRCSCACDLAGDPTFAELLRRVRDECLDAYTHQDLPFEKLVEDLQPERDLGRNPLFQVTFQLVNTPSLDGDGAADHPPGLEVQRGSAIFDLAFTLIDGPELRGAIEYSTQLFEPATIVRFAAHYKKLLAAVVTDPERRPAGVVLTTERERAALGGVHPTTEGPAPDVVARGQGRGTGSAVGAGRPRRRRDADGLRGGGAHRRRRRPARRRTAPGRGRASASSSTTRRGRRSPCSASSPPARPFVPLDPDYPTDRTGFMLERRRLQRRPHRAQRRREAARRRAPRGRAGRPADRGDDAARAPASPERRRRRLRHLHVGVDGHAPGRRRPPIRARQPHGVDAAGLPPRRRRPCAATHLAVLRRLRVGAPRPPHGRRRARRAALRRPARPGRRRRPSRHARHHRPAGRADAAAGPARRARPARRHGAAPRLQRRRGADGRAARPVPLRLPRRARQPVRADGGDDRRHLPRQRARRRPPDGPDRPADRQRRRPRPRRRRQPGADRRARTSPPRGRGARHSGTTATRAPRRSASGPTRSAPRPAAACSTPATWCGTAPTGSWSSWDGPTGSSRCGATASSRPRSRRRSTGHPASSRASSRPSPAPSATPSSSPTSSPPTRPGSGGSSRTPSTTSSTGGGRCTGRSTPVSGATTPSS